MNIARFSKTAFLWTTCSLYFSKILCGDRYKNLMVIFGYFKIRTRSRENFTIDRSKCFVKRCFFLNQDFYSPSKIFLLFNHFASTKIYKELKLQRETSGSMNKFGFKFQQVHLVWNHQARAYYAGFIKSFAVNVFGS